MKDSITVDRHILNRRDVIYKNLETFLNLTNFFWLNATVSISLNFQRVHVIKEKEDKVGTIRERKEGLVKEFSSLTFEKFFFFGFLKRSYNSVYDVKSEIFEYKIQI